MKDAMIDPPGDGNRQKKVIRAHVEGCPKNFSVPVDLCPCGGRDVVLAASSADPIPSEIDPPCDCICHQDATQFRCACKGCDGAKIAAAVEINPALRTLSQQWRDRAVATDAFAMEPQHSEQARSNLQHLAAQMELCAADLDRLCPEIRDEPKSDPV